MRANYDLILEGAAATIYRHLNRKDGSSVYAEIKVKLLEDGNLIAFARDITQRDRAERAIRDSEEKYRTLIEEASDAILIHSFDGTIHEFNKTCYKLLGYSKEEYASLHLKDILVEGIITNRANYEAIMAGETKTVYRHLKRKDGAVIEAEVTVKLLADGKVISFTRDITERKKAEEAIRKEKNILASVINSLPGIFYLLDEQLSFIRWNKNFETISGYSANEIAIMHPLDFFSNGDKPMIIHALEKVMTEGEVYQEANFYTKNHKKIPYYFTAFKMQNEDDIQFVGTGFDITGLKNAETKMRSAIERYDILAQATSDTIWDWDIGNNIMHYNEGIYKMFGYRSTEVKDLVDWWNEKVHPDDLEELNESMEEIYEKKPKRFQFNYRFRCADGTYKYIYDRAFVIYDAAGTPARMIGAMQDVTYEKEEEQRIAKAIIDAQEEERRYIGQELHDNVNQILASSLLSLSMVKENMNNPQKATDFAELARQHTLNAVTEIRKLSHELVPSILDDTSLKEIFETLLFSINLNGQFTIRFDFDERINTSSGEEIHLHLYRILQEQVKNIMNYSAADSIDVALSLEESIIRMRIFDNGKGFDMRNIKKGIGFSNMKKRAEALGGKLIINSKPGKGCELAVEIPVN